MIKSKDFLTIPMLGFLVTALVIGAVWPLAGSGQTKKAEDVKNSHQRAAQKTANSNDLAKKLAELRSKVGHLEAVVKKNFPGQSSQTGHGKAKKEFGGMMHGRGMMGGGMGMQMMGGQGMGMKGADGMDQMMKMMQMMMQMKMMEKQGGMSGMAMGKMSGGQGMEMMGGTHAKGRMQTSSALPGFPGASHIYHVGATGYFLDHPQHIILTKEQQTSLNKIKEKASLLQESYQRKTDEAEKELFVLTGSDQPDAGRIETKIREVEKLRVDKRLAFIRAVGAAAKTLTADQRKVLLGFLSPKVGESDHSKHKKPKDKKSK